MGSAGNLSIKCQNLFKVVHVLFNVVCSTSEWDFALNLYHNKIIRSYLSTHINTTGAVSISEMINTNRTLQLLDISWNSICDEGITVIARTLDNARISELLITACKITVTGAEVLAESLKSNHTIKLLNMKSNRITVSGAIAILDAAVNNGVCQEVIIDSDYKSDDKVKELMTILEERKRQEVGSIIT